MAYKILSSVEPPKIDDILATAFKEEGFKQFTDNAHKTGIIDRDGLETFCRNLYIDWRANIIKRYSSSNVDVEQELVKFLQNERLNPKNITANGHSYYKIILNLVTKRLNNEFFDYLRPAIMQGQDDFTKRANDGFLHVFSDYITTQRVTPIECRLYLNLKGENISKFVNEFYLKCKEKGKPFYFRFNVKDNRNDNFVIYTNYRNAHSYVNIIEQIKLDHPNLFVGTEKTSENFGKINSYIGFGDEPNPNKSKTKQGYLSLRKRVIEESMFRMKFDVKNSFSTEMEEKFNGRNLVDFASNEISLMLPLFDVFPTIPAGQRFEVMNDIGAQFVQALKSYCFNGKMPQSFSTKLNGKQYKFDFKDFNLIDYLKKELNLSHLTDFQMRGYMCSGLFLSTTNNRLEPNMQKFINSIYKNLLNKLKSMDENSFGYDRAIKVLRMLEKKNGKVTADGMAELYLIASHYVNYGNISLFLENEPSLRLKDMTYPIIKDYLGNEKIEQILKEKCKKYDVSYENFHNNESTLKRTRHRSDEIEK